MKAYLETYGCTANKADACIIKGLLQENQHQMVSTADAADVLILVTCTVIGTTEQRMLSRLRTLKQVGKPLIVAGCMAAVQEELIHSIVPDARLLPSPYIHHIVDFMEGKKTMTCTTRPKTTCPKQFTEVIAPLAIAEGCLFSCAYCITSQARGQLVSYPLQEITQDIQTALDQGCKEIQLTAQDTGSYGMEEKGKQNLGDLLQAISTMEGAFRVRVGMMNPFTAHTHLSSILQGFADKRIYKFVHLPVQSGDNDLLQKMNRQYTVEEFITIVGRFRQKYPEVTLSTDIIVGFPTETEECFDHTIELLETVKPDITNITRYSARPHTKAKTMNGRIATHVAKERSKLLTDLCAKLSFERNIALVGNRYTALITEEGKKKTMLGRTETYKPVVVNEQCERGRFVPVEITDAAPTYLVGKII